MLRDAMSLVGGWVLAVLVLGYLHAELQLAWALGVAAVAAGLRRVLAPSYAGLPRFLADPIDLGVVVLGVAIAGWVTLGSYPSAYWLLRWRAAVGVAVAAVLLGLGLATVVYTHRRLAREIERQEAHLSELRHRALRAQLGALQAQVNPHFLFNALNALSEVVYADPEEAERLIADLAHMMRYALRASSGEVTLRTELENVRRYLHLEGARLGERLRTEIVADDPPDVPVPGLFLQPLVENAVKYAAAARTEGGLVRVEVHPSPSGVDIVVEDDGPGLPAEVRARLEQASDAVLEVAGTGGAGGGLVNVQRRLQLGFGDAYGISAAEREGGGTRLTLRLPLRPPLRPLVREGSGGEPVTRRPP